MHISCYPDINKPRMKYISRIYIPIFLLFMVINAGYAQERSGRPDKLYTMSGAGFSIPVGENSDFMRPKFSTTLGANLGLGEGRLFLYPKLSLHVFGYDKNEAEPEYPYTLKTGRSTTYLLNVAIGYRKIVNRFAFYGFIGGGGGFILSPRIQVNESNNTAELSNKSNPVGIIEPGAGIEYNIGGANLFIEASYMNGLGKIQGKNFAAIPLSIGIKPNLSKLFR